MNEGTELTVSVTVSLRCFTVRAAVTARKETVALLGPTGSGKSTVLAAIAGFLSPAQGRIALAGRVLFDSARGVNLPPEERNIGLVPQDYALFPHLTVEQNVAFGLRFRRLPPRTVQGHVRKVLAMMGLSHVAGVRPDCLSGGERQRVALARSLVLDPDALLLDEPLSAQDPATRHQVCLELRGVLDRLAVPVLLVTHDPGDARVLAHRTITMEQGRIVAAAPAAPGSTPEFPDDVPQFRQ